MQRMILTVVGVLGLLAAVGPVANAATTVEAKWSDILAASAAADAAIPHTVYGEDDDKADKGTAVRAASVVNAPSSVATSALPADCKMPTNLPKSAPAWTCFLGADAAKAISAKVAKARGITITPKPSTAKGRGAGTGSARTSPGIPLRSPTSGEPSNSARSTCTPTSRS